MLIAQGITAIIAMLAGVAWLKSALLQIGHKPAAMNWLDDAMNRISTTPAIWNVIAAGLSAAAAVAQGITFLIATWPSHQ